MSGADRPDSDQRQGEQDRSVSGGDGNVAPLAKTDQPHPHLPGTIHTAVEGIQEGRGRAVGVLGDVRSEEDTATLVATAVAEFGGIDIVVNNASAIHTAGTLETPAKNFRAHARGERARDVPAHQQRPPHLRDLAALKTAAVRDGEDWILNGSKTFITNGYSADLVVVAARTDPDGKRGHGISLLGVEAGMAGFSRGRKLDKVGQDESDTAELFFEDVRVPGANLIGEVNRGFIHMMAWLPQERLSNAVGCIGHAAAILDETLTYAHERKAFGQSIGAFQYNKFLLAELVTKIEVTQSFLDGAVMAHTRGELTAIDAAKAKWWASDIQNEVLDACLQLHGGYGYMNEYRVGRAWRDARVTKIWAGSNETMKELIGRDLGL